VETAIDLLPGFELGAVALMVLEMLLSTRPAGGVETPST
jgi:hypothetical protein